MLQEGHEHPQKQLEQSAPRLPMKLSPQSTVGNPLHMTEKPRETEKLSWLTEKQVQGDEYS